MNDTTAAEGVSRMTATTINEAAQTSADALLTDDCLQVFNVGEGNLIATLFRAVGRDDLADKIVRHVWELEPETDRDLRPWANGHGSRKSDTDVTYEDRFEAEGDERYRFDARGWPYFTTEGEVSA